MRVPRPLSAALVAALVLTACGDAGADPEPAAAPAETPDDDAVDDGGPDADVDADVDPADDDAVDDGGVADAAGDGAFPVTVTNCDVEVTFEEAPQRVALLNSAALPTLDQLGVVDRVVARAGAFPDEYYDDDLAAALADIESLGGEDTDASGHFQISIEAVLAAEPDLVLGLPDGLTRESFADADIPVLVEPSACPEGAPEPDLTTVTERVGFYGEVFGVPDAADEAVERLEARIDGLLTEAAELPERTIAVLFPTIGGGAGYAYGNRSMAHPQVEAANLTNVFGDVDERVFEVTLEELLDQDPDLLLLLHVDGEPGPVEDEIRNLPGADGLTAVQDDAILVQLFNFTEPPTPLSVDGLERLLDAFGTDG